MTDILERLRIADKQKRQESPYSNIHLLAIDEIERLRSKVAELEARAASSPAASGGSRS